MEKMNVGGGPGTDAAKKLWVELVLVVVVATGEAVEVAQVFL